jgi:hypothetical protein
LKHVNRLDYSHLNLCLHKLAHSLCPSKFSPPPPAGPRPAPVRTSPGTVNYRFRALLETLDLLGTEERTWVVSGAIVTWPEELLDEGMEVHDPRIRFSRDGHDFACTQEVLVQIVDGIEGDWTDIWVSSKPLQDWSAVGSAGLDELDHRALKVLDHGGFALPDQGKFHDGIEAHFRCIDAAFWVIESTCPDLAAKLAAHGFATEPYQAQTLRGRW